MASFWKVYWKEFCLDLDLINDKSAPIKIVAAGTKKMFKFISSGERWKTEYGIQPLGLTAWDYPGFWRFSSQEMPVWYIFTDACSEELLRAIITVMIGDPNPKARPQDDLIK